MNVCLIQSRLFQFSGIEDLDIKRLTQNLSTLGLNMHLISQAKEKASGFKSSWKNGINIHYAPRGLSSSMPNPRDLIEIHNYIRQLHHEIEFDVMHCFNTVPGGLVGSALSKELDIPLVVSTNLQELEWFGYDSILRHALKEIHRSAHLVITPNEVTTQWVKKRFRLSNCSTILPSFDECLFDNRPIEKIYKKNIRSRIFVKKFRQTKLKGSFVVGIVGTIVMSENWLTVLAVVSSLRNVIADLKLLIIGDFQSNSTKKAWNKKVKALNVKEQIYITGEMNFEHLVSWLREIDLVYMPLTEMSFPNVLPITSSCGTPTVVKEHPYESMAFNKLTGLTIVEDGYHGLSDALEKTSKKRIVNSSSRHLIDKPDIYSVDREVKDWVRVYESMQKAQL